LFNCFLSILSSDFFFHFFSSIFSKGRKHFSSSVKVGREHFSKAANISHQGQRFGANIFKGRKHFSSSAKVGRKHFSKAANIFHQAQGSGANIFQRPRTFLIRRKGLAQTFFKVRPFFISKQIISRSAQGFIFSKPDWIFFSKVCKEQSKVLKAKANKKQYVFPSSSRKCHCIKNVKS
jgi:hypothetical protein